jgi:ubiquinol-cytochrome c reductase cytochrome b subunit
MSRLSDWLGRRLNVPAMRGAVLDREISDPPSWWNTLGAATLTAFLVQFLSGAVLATYYVAAPDHAYDSVQFIRHQVSAGSLLRSMHHWGASVTVVLIVLHLIRVFVVGAYKYPREANWLVGVGLFVVVMAFAFTGYLLPWDQRAYWATVIGTSIARRTPFVGAHVEALLRSGPDVGAATLTRFYAFHVMWFPAVLVSLIIVHIALLIHHGPSAPPAALEAGAPPKTTDEAYPVYYDEADAATKRGAHFWPDVYVRYAIVALSVVVMIVALAAVLGAGLEPPADPTDTSYIPTPEWYFLPLYQLLTIVPPWMESLAAVGVPGALVVVLLALPFFDRKSTRSLRKRPVALASLVILLAGAGLLLGMAMQHSVATPAVEPGPPLTAVQHAGRAMFWSQQCNLCHRIGSEGADVGPELTKVGLRHSAAWMHSFIMEPGKFHAGSPMPSFGPPRLSHEEIEEIAQYLASLRGGAGPEVQAELKDSFPQ